MKKILFIVIFLLTMNFIFSKDLYLSQPKSTVNYAGHTFTDLILDF